MISSVYLKSFFLSSNINKYVFMGLFWKRALILIDYDKQSKWRTI